MGRYFSYVLALGVLRQAGGELAELRKALGRPKPPPSEGRVPFDTLRSLIKNFTNYSLRSVKGLELPSIDGRSLDPRGHALEVGMHRLRVPPRSPAYTVALLPPRAFR